MTTSYKDYNLILSAVKPTPGTIIGRAGFKCDIFRGPKHNETVMAANLRDLTDQVKRAAESFGVACVVTVIPARGVRKPPGFDKAFDGGVDFFDLAVHPYFDSVVV